MIFKKTFIHSSGIILGRMHCVLFYLQPHTLKALHSADSLHLRTYLLYEQSDAAQLMCVMWKFQDFASGYIAGDYGAEVSVSARAHLVKYVHTCSYVKNLRLRKQWCNLNQQAMASSMNNYEERSN